MSDPCDACAGEVGDEVVEIEAHHRIAGQFEERSFCTLCPTCGERFIRAMEEVTSHGKAFN